MKIQASALLEHVPEVAILRNEVLGGLFLMTLAPSEHIAWPSCVAALALFSKHARSAGFGSSIDILFKCRHR